FVYICTRLSRKSIAKEREDQELRKNQTTKQKSPERSYTQRSRQQGEKVNQYRAVAINRHQ
ncbi:MAG: hypothetical protein KBF93_16055, partial [Leptospiraceae bacterium]|nr:hypothetical protein [Leptospiraceae bacterium]